jgi:fido (protein-threonine AMPylation protein)
MPPSDFQRPEGKTELEDREAAGFWKAISVANERGKDTTPIDVGVILAIHRCILEEANPEAAGRFRKAGEDIKKLRCIEPPLGAAVHEHMHVFEGDLEFKLRAIPHHSPSRRDDKAHRAWIDSILDLAAWTQHKLVAIHPFTEANGRTARLMTNVVLRRFGFPPSDVKIEADSKDRYLNALCQIDEHADYRPLKAMILAGSLSTLKKEKSIRQHKQAE